jgi:hypothetical protein
MERKIKEGINMGRKVKGIVNNEGRTCTECGEFKNWSEFYTKTNGTCGYKSECKECTKKYQKENAERILANKKQYYEENAERITGYQKQYNNSNANYETYKDQLTPFESPRQSKNGYLKVRCATCMKYFTPTTLQVRNRVQSLKGNKIGERRMYCSDECKNACSVYNQSSYPKGFKKPSNREYSVEFRNMILERDHYTCQVCGEVFDKKHLQAHHITPVVCSPMEQVDIDNGMCVCKECHIDLHMNQEGLTYSELSKVGRDNS